MQCTPCTGVHTCVCVMVCAPPAAARTPRSAARRQQRVCARTHSLSAACSCISEHTHTHEHRGAQVAEGRGPLRTLNAACSKGCTCCAVRSSFVLSGPSTELKRKMRPCASAALLDSATCSRSCSVLLLELITHADASRCRFASGRARTATRMCSRLGTTTAQSSSAPSPPGPSKAPGPRAGVGAPRLLPSPSSESCCQPPWGCCLLWLRCATATAAAALLVLAPPPVPPRLLGPAVLLPSSPSPSSSKL